MILRISRLAVVSIIIASLGLLSVLNDKVMAGVPDWNAGYIISDQVFTDTSRMSVSQIQTFLNSKVPNCDTYGQALSEFGGPDTNGDGKVQRWEWGQANYSQTVFPCLKDVRVADGRSAAQVIYDVSQQYGINPQVFIVLLSTSLRHWCMGHIYTTGLETDRRAQIPGSQQSSLLCCVRMSAWRQTLGLRLFPYWSHS